MTDTRTRVLDWEATAGALFAREGITTGLWHIGVILQMAGASTPWMVQDGQDLAPQHWPTALIGLSGIGLTEVTAPGPMIFDAAAAAMGRPCATWRLNEPPAEARVVEAAPPRKRKSRAHPKD
jgi:hypothetical protein